MTTGIERPVASLAACAEIAERLTPELGNSLRWLAANPGSGAILIIEGFVRDGELVLIVDMPGGSGLDPSRRSTSKSGNRRGLLSWSVSLAREGPESVREH